MLTHMQPQSFDTVEFRGVRREEQRNQVGAPAQSPTPVPARLVEYNRTDRQFHRAPGHVPNELPHRLGVDLRGDRRRGERGSNPRECSRP